MCATFADSLVILQKNPSYYALDELGIGGSEYPDLETYGKYSCEP